MPERDGKRMPTGFIKLPMVTGGYAAIRTHRSIRSRLPFIARPLLWEMGHHVGGFH